jgi:hypothetical protein
MAAGVYAAIWSLAFGSIIAGNLFVHRHYTQRMQQEIQQFEVNWQKLEKRYGKN